MVWPIRKERLRPSDRNLRVDGRASQSSANKLALSPLGFKGLDRGFEHHFARDCTPCSISQRDIACGSNRTIAATRNEGMLPFLARRSKPSTSRAGSQV